MSKFHLEVENLKFICRKNGYTSSCIDSCIKKLLNTLMVLIFAHGKKTFFARINFRSSWKSLLFARIKFRASSNFYLFFHLFTFAFSQKGNYIGVSMSENKISFMNINKTIGLLGPESYRIYTTKYQ